MSGEEKESGLALSWELIPAQLLAAADSVKRDKALAQDDKNAIVRVLWQLSYDIENGIVVKVSKPKGGGSAPVFGEV
jgi:hypothetical protein